MTRNLYTVRVGSEQKIVDLLRGTIQRHIYRLLNGDRLLLVHFHSPDTSSPGIPL
jgi:hypothetical protein